ncbi:MAG: succinate dehydrogenase, cytochrome b556 subunit [Burkholderiales bacterium]|nr:succinate dehydrogenase, cytochrome b556 subunit [Burkholderiales bacterium]
MAQTAHLDAEPAALAPQRRAKARPAFFDLLQIQLPVGAVTSILHRVSGVLLALAIPFGVFLLGLSLQGAHGYAEAAAVFGRWPVRVGLVAVIWALSHHLLAGLRHLLMDVDLGSRLRSARRSAWTVNLAAGALAILAGVVLL